ncbi:MAG: hypothetical protein HY820_32195 [Acidobacteria bacterium]|nr:hypothetical protein [Acidobacteriota bacterium]
MKGRSDVAVVTLNMDDNPGLIEPLMKQLNLSFPVLLARELVEEIEPAWSLPRSWIVDTVGNIRLESVGFGGDGEKWISRMMEGLRQIK